MKNATRPAIFKWRQTAPEMILCAVRWYLRYSLSLRDVEELLAERGLEADHTTIWRWVQRYGPELEQRLRRHLKPTNKSWRVDERKCCNFENGDREGPERNWAARFQAARSNSWSMNRFCWQTASPLTHRACPFR